MLGEKAMKQRFVIVGLTSILATSALFASKPSAPTEIVIDANAPVDAVIESIPAQLMVSTGLVDRLTLNTEFVDKQGIKPAPIAGKANLNFWGRKEIEGKNRPLDYAIKGQKEKGRAFWFLNVPQPKYDGSIGPWAIPYDQVTVQISSPKGTEQSHDFPYFGDLSNGSVTGHKDPSFGTAVTFGVERDLPYPLASAATGAAIAAAYGGTLSGEAWDQPVGFGITRPVRLMTLERPFILGPFAFTKIAVRTRSARDAAGSGEAIAESADPEDVDPQEIIVTGLGKKAKNPAFTFAIGRTTLNQCASITYDKVARKIILRCRAS
jgi:hypothetical protein